MSGGSILPPQVAREAAMALGESDQGEPFVEAAPLGGGCIHPAARVVTRSGAVAFVKWSRAAEPAGFDVEARGLEALAERGGVRVPRVLGVGPGASGGLGWLLLEFVEEGPPAEDTAERLGAGLARLHRPLPLAEPGWEEDGWIGTLPQPNRSGRPGTGVSAWPGFWREARLLPRWETAAHWFDVDTRRRWDRLVGRLEHGLAGWQNDGLSLLHGDLWSGNVLTGPGGEPFLVDPAVYRGHREVDLAMMELFGGFSPAAFGQYREVAPLGPGYEEVRRDLYQLYPLLVHVDLFGGGYVPRVRERIERLSGELA